MKALRFVLALMLVVVWVLPASAALTIDNKRWDNIGSKNMLVADVDWDSSYAFGGESLDFAALGFTNVVSVKMQSHNGVNFEYDYTNKKMKAFTNAPPIVFEEAVTVTSNVGTLRYPAAYIMYVGVGNAGYKVIPGGLTPVTGTVSVSEPVWGTRNTLTFLAGDTVTACYVTYVTQAWKEVFDNYVLATLTAGARVTGHADLTFTAGTPDTLDLGELAVAIQSVMWNDNGTYKGMKALYIGQDPATTEVAVDFSNASSSETRLSFREEDTVDASTDTIYVSYIKKPASGFLYDRFIEEDDITPSTDVLTASSGLAISNMLIYGSFGDLPGATGKYANIIRSAGSVSTTATLVQPTSVFNNANTFTLGSDHGDGDHVKPSYIAGAVSEIPGIVQLEAPNGLNLEDLTNVRVEIIGY
jgi:hypothetical protein